MATTKCVKDTQANNDALRDIIALAGGYPLAGTNVGAGTHPSIAANWDGISTAFPIGWTQYLEANWTGSTDTALPISDAEATLLQTLAAQGRVTSAQNALISSAIAARQNVDLRASGYSEQQAPAYAQSTIVQWRGKQGTSLAPLIVHIAGQSNANGRAPYNGTLPFPIDYRVITLSAGDLIACAPNINGNHGMQIFLGATLANATGRNVILSTGAVDGSPISTWGSGGSNDGVTVAACAAAVSGWPSDIQHHLCFLHGETDATNGITYAAYLSGIQGWIARYRALLPGITIRVHILKLTINDSGPGLANVRQAQIDCAAADGNADIVDLDAYTPALGSEHWDSDQHRLYVAPAFNSAILASL